MIHCMTDDRWQKKILTHEFRLYSLRTQSWHSHTNAWMLNKLELKLKLVTKTIYACRHSQIFLADISKDMKEKTESNYIAWTLYIVHTTVLLLFSVAVHLNLNLKLVLLLICAIHIDFVMHLKHTIRLLVGSNSNSIRTDPIIRMRGGAK